MSSYSHHCAVHESVCGGHVPGSCRDHAARLQSVGLKLKKSELKAARTLGVVVFVYLMCYCPFYGYVVVIVNLPNTPSVPFLFFLFYFNSCLNPVIYALFYSWFGKAIKLIVTLQILQPGSCQANVLQ